MSTLAPQHDGPDFGPGTLGSGSVGAGSVGAGSVAVVTGAASGIGAGIAEDLLASGVRVFNLDLTAGDVAEHIYCDVSSAESVSQAAAAVRELTGGGIDYVVANAGVRGPDRAAENLDSADFDRVIGVNLRGVFLTLQAFAPDMLAAGRGAMVAIASMSGNRVVNVPQRTVAYNVAKAGVTALVRDLAVEWGPRGIRVNAVSPGYVSTPLLEADRAMHDIWLPHTVPGRFASIAEIVGAVRFLLSDAAGYCHGTDLLVDGGYSLR